MRTKKRGERGVFLEAKQGPRGVKLGGYFLKATPRLCQIRGMFLGSLYEHVTFSTRAFGAHSNYLSKRPHLSFYYIFAYYIKVLIMYKYSAFS